MRLLPNSSDNIVPPRSPALEVLARASLPTRFGKFQIISFREPSGKTLDDVAVIRGEIADQAAIPTRMHSECLTGDALGSVRCDCRDQLEIALERLVQLERGILLYLRQEGRGIGIASKVAAYQLQDGGMDTVQANHHLGFDDDLRRYDRAAAMLHVMKVGSIELHTNNPKKLHGLLEHGIDVIRRVAIIAEERSENRDYLATKRSKSGHIL
jgi:GTP cyclohydrolase II